MRGRAYRLAELILGGAAYQGGDLLGTVMLDSDHPRQALFLSMWDHVIPAEAHRQILLEGMANEYASLDSWDLCRARDRTLRAHISRR